jgi:4-hydroxybutyrate CoA-transferase
MKNLSDFPGLLSCLPKSPTIVLHSACAQPEGLAAQLAAHAALVHGAHVVTLMPMGHAPYADPPALAHLRTTTFFPGRALRGAARNGAVDVTRVPLSGLCALFDSGILRADLLLLNLSPPDSEGAMTLGVSVDYMRSVLAQRPLVIAELDTTMPATSGNTRVLENEVDFAVEAQFAVTEMPPPEGSDIDRMIAGHIAALVPDGAVIQSGIGAIPDLALMRLTHLRNLGFRSGTVTDAILPLMESGAITGLSVATMATGTQALYRFLHRNKEFEFHPCSHTHDLALLSTIPRLHAINSVLTVDLAGAANAEQLDGISIAGPGGLPDFAHSASCAPGGRSIVALRSTSRDGRTSNIRGAIGTDGLVTVPSGHVDCIVTEYGVAHVKGLRGSARARAIAQVAHPDFRAGLSSQA